MNSGTGVFLVTPTSAQFGSVAVGQTSAMQVQLVNKTLQSVEISAITLNGSQFSIVGAATLPVTVASGGTYTFSVQFAPTTTGPVTGQVTVATVAESTGSTVVALSGTGTTAAALTPSTMTCSPNTFTAAGTATCSVTLSAAAPSGGTALALTSNNSAVTLPSSATVVAGASSVSFIAQVAAVSAAQTATLTAKANGGTATTTLTLSPSGAVLSVNTRSIAFGNVLIGDTATQDLTMTSAGTLPVVINSATLSGTGFLLSGVSFPATLQPGQTATISVAFSPSTAGTATGTLSIVNTSLASPTTNVALTGIGTNQAVSLTWDAPATDDVLVNYHIYRATSGSSTYALVGSVSSNATAYQDAQIASGATYLYYVTSVSNGGLESVPSNTATVAVP